MGWAFVWMMLVLKIPIFALGWIVWHAIKSVPETDEAPAAESGGGGGERPRPRQPRPPRRGPHGEPLPQAPARIRAVGDRSTAVR